MIRPRKTDGNGLKFQENKAILEEIHQRKQIYLISNFTFTMYFISEATEGFLLSIFSSFFFTG